jgi:hypothetical protein
MSDATTLVGDAPSVPAYLDLKAASRLIPGRDGKPTHTSTLTRWILRGSRLQTGERVRLRALRTPGGWKTTGDWLDGFLETLTTDRIGEHQDTSQPATSSSHRRTAAQRRAAAERAARELATMGV